MSPVLDWKPATRINGEWSAELGAVEDAHAWRLRVTRVLRRTLDPASPQHYYNVTLSDWHHVLAYATRVSQGNDVAEALVSAELWAAEQAARLLGELAKVAARGQAR